MDASTFEERQPHETGFAPLYAAEILPLYRETRDQAEEAARGARFKARAVLALGVVVAAVIALVQPYEGDTPRWLVPVVLLVVFAVIAGVITRGAKARFNRRMKDRIAPILAHHVGVTDYIARPAASYLDLTALHQLGILPHFTDVRIEDGMTGQWRDVGYRLAEVSLRRRKSGGGDDDKEKWERVFRGLALEVETPVDMPWTVFEAGPRGLLGTFAEAILAARGLRPVDYGLGDAAPFRVYSQDPARAAELVPAIFLETLVQIASDQGQGPRRIDAGFRGRTFHLCLRRGGSFLELNAYDTDAAAFQMSCREALSDMALPRRVIDLLIDGPSGR